MVRIGEEQEKIIQQLQKVNGDLQGRILNMESKTNLVDVNF